MLKKFIIFLFILIPSFIFPMCTCTYNKAIGSPYAQSSSPFSVAFSPSGCLAVANPGTDNISIFKADPTTCSLSLIGNYNTGQLTAPSAVAFSANGSCLAAANFGNNTVSIHTVASDCTLTPVSGSPFAAGASPTSVAFSPVPCSNGSYLLAVANNISNNVSIYTVNPTNCNPTEISGSPFSTGVQPTSVAFSPSGNCLAVTNAGDNTISMFTVNSTSCSLNTPANTFTTGPDPVSVAFSPNGSCLAVTNQKFGIGNGSVSMFTVNSDCTLTAVAGSPFGTGPGPNGVAFSPNSSCLAVANQYSDTISIFTVNSGCTLSEITGSPFVTGTNPISVAFAPNGSCLAVANSEDFVATIVMLTTEFSLIDSAISANCNGTATITGIANPANFITIYEGNTPVSTTVTAAATTGSFTVTTNTLSSGTHTLTARSANFANPSCFHNFVLGNVDISPITSLTLGASPSAICLGQSSTLTATITGGVASYTYHFSDGYSITTDATTVTHTVTPLTTTTYSVTVTDSNGCTSSSPTISVTVNRPPSLTISGTTAVCEGNSIILTAHPSGGSGFYTTYIWTTPNRGTITTVTPTLTLTNATMADSGTYTVTVTDTNGCISSPASINVAVADILSILLSTSHVSIPCPENLTDITANFVCGTLPYTQATISNGVYTITIPNK